MPQEGYGTASVIPDQGIFLAASVYRPVFEVTCLVVVCFICVSHYHYYVVHEDFFLQFMNKIGLMLPQKYSQLGYCARSPNFNLH